MRTDAIIDKQQVRCPKASTLGYGKWKAQHGDWVVFTLHEGDRHVGRVLGRVHYAPALGGERRAIRNWLLVAKLNDNLTHAAEYWVNPDWVTEVHANAPDISRFLQWFASDDLLKGGPEHGRRLLHYGAASANQQADEPSWDCEHKRARFEQMETRIREARKTGRAG